MSRRPLTIMPRSHGATKGQAGVAGSQQGWATIRALRARPGQALAAAALSALAVLTAVSAPLYERSVEQAQVRRSFTDLAPADRGLSFDDTDTSITPGTLLTGRAQQIFTPPIGATDMPVVGVVARVPVQTRLLARDNACQHLTFVSGRCAAAAGEVMINTRTAARLGWGLGNVIDLQDNPSNTSRLPLAPLTVVGLFTITRPSDDYWFGHTYQTAAGAVLQTVDRSSTWTADPLLVASTVIDQARSDFSKKYPDEGLALTRTLETTVIPTTVGVDDLATIRATIDSVQYQLDHNEPAVTLSTDLPTPLAEIASARRASQTIITVLGIESTLLALVVLGIVLAAAAEVRQPEFALARLRGWPIRRAAGFYAREIGLALIVGAVPGLVLGWLLVELAGRTLLDGAAGPELRLSALGWGAAALVVALLMTLLIGRRAAQQPVHEMLRRVPARTSARGVTVVESTVVVGALAGVLVLTSGDRQNPVAVIGPFLIALAVGLILSRLVVRLARRIGARALWRGRVAVGLAWLQTARRPGLRRVVVLLCVSSALVVSGAVSQHTATANRQARAEVTVGAPVVLGVNASTVTALRKAVTAADPTGRYASPILIHTASSGDDLVAVVPDQFARISTWGWAANRPSIQQLIKVKPVNPPKAIRFVGTDLTVTLASLSFKRTIDPGTTGTSAPVRLQVIVQRANGTFTSTSAVLPETSRGPVALSSAVDCATGCRLARIAVSQNIADFSSIKINATIGTVVATDAKGRTQSINLGQGKDWGPTITVNNSDDVVPSSISLDAASDGLALSSFNDGGGTLTLQHLDVPVELPCLVAGTLEVPPTTAGRFQAGGLDGSVTYFRSQGTLVYLPGASTNAVLTDYDLMTAATGSAVLNSSMSILLARDDPKAEAALRQALAKSGVQVVNRTTAAAERARLDHSAPAWSTTGAVAMSIFGVLIAALLILISGLITVRPRRRDARAMRLTGVPQTVLVRSAVLEQLSVLVVAVLIGGLIGLVGARLALPGQPLFVRPAPAPPIRYPIPAELIGSIIGLVLVVAVIAGLIVALRFGSDSAVGRRRSTVRGSDGSAT